MFVFGKYLFKCLSVIVPVEGLRDRNTYWTSFCKYICLVWWVQYPCSIIYLILVSSQLFLIFFRIIWIFIICCIWIAKQSSSSSRHVFVITGPSIAITIEHKSIQISILNRGSNLDAILKLHTQKSDTKTINKKCHRNHFSLPRTHGHIYNAPVFVDISDAEKSCDLFPIMCFLSVCVIIHNSRQEARVLVKGLTLPSSSNSCLQSLCVHYRDTVRQCVIHTIQSA